MADQHARPQNVANQVMELAQQAKQEALQRQKVSAERREQQQAVEAWFSRKAAVLIALVVTVPIFAALLVIDLTGESLVDLATPDPAPMIARQTAGLELDGVVRRVEAFRSDYSELPRSLVEVGTSSKGDWSYVTQGSGYVITVKMYGQTLTYDSEQHKPGPAPAAAPSEPTP